MGCGATHTTDVAPPAGKPVLRVELASPPTVDQAAEESGALRLVDAFGVAVTGHRRIVSAAPTRDDPRDSAATQIVMAPVE